MDSATVRQATALRAEFEAAASACFGGLLAPGRLVVKGLLGKRKRCGARLSGAALARSLQGSANLKDSAVCYMAFQ